MITCNDCQHSISMNDLCEKPIQAASNMLRHMASHNATRAFVAPHLVQAELIPSSPLVSSHLEHEYQWIAPSSQSPN